jgi:hypothetical protein
MQTFMPRVGVAEAEAEAADVVAEISRRSKSKFSVFFCVNMLGLCEAVYLFAIV